LLPFTVALENGYKQAPTGRLKTNRSNATNRKLEVLGARETRYSVKSPFGADGRISGQSGKTTVEATGISCSNFCCR
jgi:hypothetical protein